MIQRLAALSPRALALIAAGAVVVYAAAAWFLLVAPKRSEAARLEADVAAAELRLAEAQAAAGRPQAAGVPVTDLLRLAKAMPGSVDQASLVLELSRLAQASRVTLAAVTPQAPVVTTEGATALPVAVSVGGGYFDIVRFLRNTRGLVTMRRGKLRATGRLFTVESLELAESNSKRFPQLDATITLHAYVYDGPIAPPEKAEPPSEELEPTGASAAGSTP